MSIKHASLPTNYTRPPGYDLRSAVTGGEIRYGSKEAVDRFREVMAQQEASKKPAKQPRTKAEKVAAQLAAKQKERQKAMITEPTTLDAETAPLNEEDLPESAQAIVEMAATAVEPEVIDNSASRQFHQERTNAKDPKPITIEQVTGKRPKRKKKKRLTDDEVRSAHDEFWQGTETVAEVAARWGVADSTLSIRWKKLNLLTPGRGANRYSKRKETAVVATIPAKAEIAAKAETAVVPVAPATRALAEANGHLPETTWLPADLKSRLAAFQAEMAEIGVPVNITMSLHLSKEVQL
ncbi:MAG: hypothetical protein H6658_02215 [Ardenticatenaceae bacterium]|nr:hypothetical protein [Ardenticatenaceae bacterium]